jgi:hypothetical protein
MATHSYGANDLRTNQQNSRLFVLLGKLDIDSEQRGDLVHQFTGGRETSSRLMLAHECNSLIHHLEAQLDGIDGGKLYRMRRKVFSLAHELGWEEGSGKVDKDRLNGWLMKYGQHKKDLLAMTTKELRDTVTQMERMNAKADRNG